MLLRRSPVGEGSADAYCGNAFIMRVLDDASSNSQQIGYQCFNFMVRFLCHNYRFFLAHLMCEARVLWQLVKKPDCQFYMLEKDYMKEIKKKDSLQLCFVIFIVFICVSIMMIWN